MRRLGILVALAATGLAGPVAARAAAPVRPADIAPIPRGVVQVIANVPAPGYPALPLVWGGDIFEGTYTAGGGSTSAHSHVFKFSPTGTLMSDFTVGDQPTEPYGVQVANVDAAGDLVALDDTSGRVLLMNPGTGATTLYATIPDIPLCSDAGASAECSDALTEETPEPDYAAWGPDGSLYVTDYQQAVIWRIPPHGGTPSIWLAGTQLDGELFGTAGIWMEPDHRTLMFDQSSNLGGSSDAATGKLYSVQIQADGTPGPVTQLWESGPAALPDGFAVAQSGDIYLAENGPSGDDIVELSPSGAEITNFGTPVTGANGSPIPFDEPSGVAFFDSDLIIANQSYLAGNTANMALLALGTGETGQRVYVPADAGPVMPAVAPVRPVKTKPVVTKKPVKKKTAAKKKPVKKKTAAKKPTVKQTATGGGKRG